MKTEDVLFEVLQGKAGNIGLITLNRQHVLNALNQSMFEALYSHLLEWEENTAIKAVIIRAAEGRAFCAGGDVREVYNRKEEGEKTKIDFFQIEYALNRKIYHYSKPYIALLDGITMGGGAGISLHGSHRVGTKQLVFAMPETRIGFFPDIGSSYFLSRLPNKVGLYLGLSGERINDKDCYALGLIDAILEQSSFNPLIEELVVTDLRNKQSVTEIIKKNSLVYEESSLLIHKNDILSCFSGVSVENIIQALEESKTPWCVELSFSLRKKSPTSLKVTLEQLRRAEKLDFDRCMDMEYKMMQHFLRSHDFFEGVRAALVDKDNNPHWKPASLKDVSHQSVLNYFS